MATSGSEHSILAETVLQFISQREVVATAGLGHVLRRSAVAREYLQRLVASAGAELPSEIQYRNEEYDENSPGRPDIVGRHHGVAHILLEGKFWAARTENQPCRYLDQLSAHGFLLFVAPARRRDLLWAELLDRCRGGGYRPRDTVTGQRSIFCTVGESQRMAITSWTTLLGDVRDELDARSESHLRSDVEQLLSLCELEDEEAFLPLTPADLATPRPIRVLQLMRLVDKLNARGLARGLFAPTKMHRYNPPGICGRWISSGRFQLALSVDLQRWHAHGAIPMWVEVAAEPGHALAGLEEERPPRVSYDGFDGRPVIGLPLPLYVEEPQVIEGILDELAEILSLLEACRPTVAMIHTAEPFPDEDQADESAESDAPDGSSP